MKNSVKAILIDPVKQQVSEVQVTRDDSGTFLSSIYEHLGNGTQLFEDVCIIAHDRKNKVTDRLAVDEEGLYHDMIGGFHLKTGPYPILVGRGLIVGVDANGETTDCVTLLEIVQSAVVWNSIEDCKNHRKNILGISTDKD